MAILGPEQLPVVLKLNSDPIKFEVLSQLGHPVVHVELTEAQLEQAIRVTGDFIAQYFPFEEKYAYIQTQPLVSTYDLPPDAYWVKDVKWDPATTRIGDIFGAECTLCSTHAETKVGTKSLGDVEVGNELLSYDNDGNISYSKVLARKFNIKKCYKMICGNREIVTSIDHPFLTINGWRTMGQLRQTDFLFFYNDKNIDLLPITSITEGKEQQTVDFQIENQNFVCNGFVMHNSFLFCYPGGSNILTTQGPMLAETLFDKVKHTKLVTAFRPQMTKMRWNQKKQPIIVLKTEKDYLMCTPNHPVSCNGKFKPVDLCNIGEKLVNHKDKYCEIIDKQLTSTNGTWSMQNKTGSLYVSSLGKEFYLAH